MELRFQVRVFQEFSRFELPELVQCLFLQELLQRFLILVWNKSSPTSTCFLATCFQIPWLEEIPKVVLHVVVTCQHTFVHRYIVSSRLFLRQAELLTPFRCCSVNTELIYRMKCSEQEFFVWQKIFEVSSFESFLPFQDSTTQSTGTFEHGWPDSLNRCTISLAVESHSPMWGYEDSPYHFLSDPGPRKVQCPCKNLIA